jgi:hypothetical protein
MTALAPPTSLRYEHGMGKVYSEISDTVAAFIAAQHMFFVASAPLDASGHVNLSPKGLDSFRILGPRQVAYLDLTGSGVETIAHVRENGRLTILFCAFEGAPKIVRLHGRGEVIDRDTPEFEALLPRFTAAVGMRSIIRLDVERVSDSCGYSVPLFEYQGDRDTLTKYAERKGEDGMAEYRQRKNARSIDGLPGV